MNQIRRNRLFGWGTLGRDMVYTMQSMFLMYFLTDILKLSVGGIAVVTVVMMVLRIFDAVNDPFVGLMIDNTRSKYGKFKPWIVIGGFFSMIASILLFADYKVNEPTYLVIFTLVYLLWGVTYTAHDIGYWAMLPALSQDQHEREKIGSIAKIVANIGLFSVVVGIVPVTEWLSTQVGSIQQAYFVLSIVLSILMFVIMLGICFVVKEDRSLAGTQQKTSVKELVGIIVKNDQLLWIVLATVLFSTAYTTTTSFGLYYFEYIYGDKDMYSVFALILAVAQLSALFVFPVLAKKFSRKQLYGFGTVLVCVGYFFFYIAHNLLTVSIAGILTFFGDGFIQILMLMFIADCVEYGEWKLGRRNDSITLALQPFIYKFSGALAAGVVGFTVILTGINDAAGPADLSPANVTLFKMAMLVIPLIVIVLGYFVYVKKYKIDSAFYQKIVKALDERRAGRVE